MGEFDLTVRLWGWWLVIPISLLALCILGRCTWGWHALLVAAVISLAVGAVTVAMLPLSWSTLYRVGVVHEAPASRASRVWNFNLASVRGGVQLYAIRDDGMAELAALVGTPAPPLDHDVIYFTRGVTGQDGYYPIWDRTYSKTPSDFVERMLGFQIAWRHLSDGPPGSPRFAARLYSITVPHWFVLILCAVCPLLWLLRRPGQHRRYRLAHGLCLKCGYELRVQKSGQAGDKCPECGTAIESRAMSAES